MSPNVWNASIPEHPHPLHIFWADRFLIYPNDPTKGPLRNNHAGEQGYRDGESVPVEKALETGLNFAIDGVAGG